MYPNYTVVIVKVGPFIFIFILLGDNNVRIKIIIKKNL